MKNKLLVLLGIVAVCIYLIIEARSTGDFFIYISASSDLFHGKDIYSELYKQWYHYYYSLLFAIILYPLTFLPYTIAQFIWLVLNAFFLYRIIKIIAGYLDCSSFTTKQKQLLWLLCLLFGLRFIRDNFHLKQITICILYLSLEGVRLIAQGNKLMGALCIALAINIKLLPIVLVPYLFYRKEIKAAAYVILFYGIMFLMPALVIGFHSNTALLGSWWGLMNPMDSKNILDVDEESFHGLSTLLSTLLVAHLPVTNALPIRRNIMDITSTQLTYILNITRLVFILFSLWFLRTKPFAPAPGKLHSFREVSYLLLLVPLIFPHQQYYAFLFIMPAASYILYCLIGQFGQMLALKRKLLLCGIIISYLACNLSLLLGEFKPYYDHFKILTYGALLIIPMLAVCPVDEIAEVKQNEVK